MKLRPKILTGYGVILLLLLIVGLLAILNLNNLGQASDEILQQNYRSILAGENMVAALERQDSSALSYLLDEDSAALSNFQENEVVFVGWLARAQDNVTLPAEPEILAEIEQTYLAYLDSFNRLQEIDPAVAERFYFEEVFPIFVQVREAAVRLRDVNQEEMVAAAARSHEVARRAIVSTSVVLLTAVILGLTIGYVLSGRIARPLVVMTAATERIAAGDYDVDLSIETETGDEVGQLAGKINEMSGKLKRFHEMNVGQVIAAQRRNEAIIRSISDGILVVDRAYLVIAINPAALQILNRSDPEVIGSHLLTLLHDDEVFESIKQTLETGLETPELDRKTLEIGRGEQTNFYKFSVTPVMPVNGTELLGAVVLLQDVTQLTELDRLKSEFVMTASHELRTPLTGLQMSINLLQESIQERLSEREGEMLQAAVDDAQRLKALINDLLDLSRIESGQVSMVFEVVDGREMIEFCRQAFSSDAKIKQITLDTHLPDESVLVQADTANIILVLTNLVANALRFTDPGGHIDLFLEARNQQAYFSVTDDGVGIPFDYQSKIFDKFVQVQDDRALGGTGLGLSISREIVRAHGGTIWVESAPGKGSRFVFTVPLSSGNYPQIDTV